MKLAPKHNDLISTASEWGNTFIQMFQELFRPLPFKKNLIYDLLSLFVLAILQFQIIPVIFGAMGTINLFLPWVGLYLIRDDHYIRCLAVILLASILLETHSSTPAGMYFLGFIVFFALLSLVKHHFSWHNYKTWLLFIGGLTAFVGMTKWVTLFIIDSSVASQFSFSIIFEVISSFLLGIIFIFYLKQKTSDRFLEGGT